MGLILGMFVRRDATRLQGWQVDHISHRDRGESMGAIAGR